MEVTAVLERLHWDPDDLDCIVPPKLRCFALEEPEDTLVAPELALPIQVRTCLDCNCRMKALGQHSEVGHSLWDLAMRIAEEDALIAIPAAVGHIGTAAGNSCHTGRIGLTSPGNFTHARSKAWCFWIAQGRSV